MKGKFRLGENTVGALLHICASMSTSMSNSGFRARFSTGGVHTFSDSGILQSSAKLRVRVLERVLERVLGRFLGRFFLCRVGGGL